MMKLFYPGVFSFRGYCSLVRQFLGRVLEKDEMLFTIVVGGRDTRLGRVGSLDPLDGAHFWTEGCDIIVASWAICGGVVHSFWDSFSLGLIVYGKWDVCYTAALIVKAEAFGIVIIADHYCIDMSSETISTYR